MTRTDRIPLAPEHRPLAQALADLLVSRFGLDPHARTVIGIGGESGSGKSITATALGEILNERGMTSQLIHQDDFFRLPPRTNHEARVRDLGHVGPHEVDLDAVAALLAAFRRGAPDVSAPLLDYPNNRFLEQRYDFSDTAVLLVEGTYVLGFPALDQRIFLEATHEDTQERRRARARDIDAPIIDEILAIEHRLIAAYAAMADIVIDRTFAITRPT
jgi:uridine kinase